MDRIISATKANRSFSRILRDVRGDQSYVVTTHGKPVARIIPCGKIDLAREVARSALFQRLAGQKVSDTGRWTRNELYER